VLTDVAEFARSRRIVANARGDRAARDTRFDQSFPTFSAAELLPWVDASRSPGDERPREVVAAELATERQRALSARSIGETELGAFERNTSIRVVTPGSPSGELLHERRQFKRAIGCPLEWTD